VLKPIISYFICANISDDKASVVAAHWKEFETEARYNMPVYRDSPTVKNAFAGWRNNVGNCADS